jgi:hypothetical protein
VKFFAAIITVVLLLVLGCGSNNNSELLIRDAILHYLAGRTDLSMGNMDVKIDRLDLKGDSATAGVTISARGDAKASMQMVYELRKTGSGWEVTPPSSGTGAAHSGMPSPGSAGPGGELPPGHPPAGGAPGGTAEQPQLPQGHPPVGDPPVEKSPELPPGHPPVGAR